MTEPQAVPYSTLGPNRMVPPTTFGPQPAETKIPPNRPPPLAQSSTSLPDQVIHKTDPSKAGPSPYDDPEFQKDLKEGIAAQIEGWQRDWSIRITALMEALDLSRPEAMLYLLLMQIGTLRGIASGFQHMWNAEPALRRRAMQDALLEAQLKERGFELGEQEDPGMPITEAAKTAAAQGWRIP